MAPRGGNQPPRRPAAVSNPQSGQRTDGGPGSSRQPVRVPTGGGYGQTQAATAQQSAAPMASGGPAAPGQPGAQGPPPDEAMGGGVFGPTDRPGEPATLGGATGAQHASENVDHLIRLMYAKFPHPAIGKLMKKEPERRAYS